jgi:isoleucyl-tRNA synthetase
VWQVQADNAPWLVGRDRAWGVPLPVWGCSVCEEQICVAGLDDLAHRLALSPEEIDPHRPAVDRLGFPCGTCGGTMHRVAEVVDVAMEAAVGAWSGIAEHSPVDLAIGLGDEHLGWLRDLGEIAALLRGAQAWEQAIALPGGRAGASGEPERLPSSDLMRWSAYTDTTLEQAEQEFLRPLLRLISEPSGDEARARASIRRTDDSQAFLDRWLEARLRQANETLTQTLAACQPRQAARALGALIRDLSNWYSYCLGHRDKVCERLSLLLAPFVPHVAEALYHRAAGRTIDSVHLSEWPTSGLSPADRAILERMDLVWRLAELGQQARQQAGIGSERLLRRAMVMPLSGRSEAFVGLVPLQPLLAELLGVAEVQIARDATARVDWRVALDPERALERGLAAEEIDAALAALTPAEVTHLALQICSGLSASLEVTGQAITLLPDETAVSLRAHPGWAAATSGGQLIVLDVG